MKIENFTTIEAAVNHGGAMEPETISKNGASSKSLMSRGNLLRNVCFALLAASIIFIGAVDKILLNFDRTAMRLKMREQVTIC